MAGQQGQTSTQQGLGFGGLGQGITIPSMNPAVQKLTNPSFAAFMNTAIRGGAGRNMTMPSPNPVIRSGIGQTSGKTPQQPQPAPVVDPVIEADIGQALGGLEGARRGRGGQARNPLRQTAPQAPNQPLAQAITVPLQQQALAQSMGQTNGKSPQLGQGFDLGGFESLFGQGFNIPDFGMGLSNTK